MQPGWEVRDQQGTILWGADKTLTGTDSIPFKGYGLPLKSYEIEANMEQAASQQYSIEGTDSVTYQSDGTAIALQIVGNETQESGTTTVPSATVSVVGIESGTDYAEFNVSDFPGAVEGDTISVIVDGTTYSLKVKKVDSSYVYLENRVV